MIMVLLRVDPDIIESDDSGRTIKYRDEAITNRHCEDSLDLRHLRAFLTVADTGNVTRAAEVLNLVQPAVSRQIQLLEEDVGAPLFVRERHGMVLTGAGRALQGYARRAMLELDRARAEIAGSDEGVGGLATLGLLPSTCDLLASALVSAVAAANPRIRVRIATGYAGTLQQWLESGEVDAALLYGTHPSPGIETTPLIEEALWVVGPASAKLRKNRPVTLASLAGKPLILPSAPHGIRTLVDHACAVSHVELTIAAETNAMSVQKDLVRGGHGLTILPAIAVADEVAREQFSIAPLSKPTIKRAIVLAVPANRAIRQHVQCAVEALVQCMRDATKRGAWLEARWLGPR
jgi:LysR family nitrogen assimilation transcriptional regulator